MKEIKGDLFNENCDAICITTNGFVKANGKAVMGRGCAKKYANANPNNDKLLGDLITKNGNICQVLEKPYKDVVGVFAFPVKPISEIFNGHNAVKHMTHRFNKGDIVPGWACIADPKIIAKSAIELVDLVDSLGLEKVVIPRPGCGAGELEWHGIKGLLDLILDDRFYTITYT